MMNFSYLRVTLTVIVLSALLTYIFTKCLKQVKKINTNNQHKAHCMPLSDSMGYLDQDVPGGSMALGCPHGHKLQPRT